MTVSDLISALEKFPSEAPVYVLGCRIDDDGYACGRAGIDEPCPRIIEAPDPEDEAAGAMVPAVLLDADAPDDVDDDDWAMPIEDEDPAALEAW